MMKIKNLLKKDIKIWDGFVDNSNNGTIFHKMRFLQYHPKGRFKLSFLGFYDEKNNLLAIMPGEEKDRVFKSPVGASYGSFATKDLSYDESEAIVDAFLERCKKRKIKEIILTPPPFVYEKRQNQYLDFLFIYKGFNIQKTLITSAVDLSTLNPDVLSSLVYSKRKAVRKAIKSGIRAELSNDIKAFYPILLDNKKKFGVSPTHTLEELERLKELFPNDIKLLLAFKGNKPIAGAVTFICNKIVALAFYIVHYVKFQEFRPTSLLYYEDIKWAKENGFKYYDIGINAETKTENPMDQVKSLIKFKETFLSTGFLRTTYHKQLK